jgi:adenylate kinase family enzyme
MVINLCGPPAAGKSAFAARFILEHPDFTYLSIDAFRIECKDEDEAWSKLAGAVLKNKKVLLESSGLSWRLMFIFAALKEGEKIDDREVFTILFTGKREILLERLKNRQKRSVPMPYHQDEIEFLDWSIEHMHELGSEPHFEIDTTVKGRTIEDIYYACCSQITKFRVKHSI